MEYRTKEGEKKSLLHWVYNLMGKRQMINKLKIKYARWWPMLWRKIESGSGIVSAEAGKVCLFSKGVWGGTSDIWVKTWKKWRSSYENMGHNSSPQRGESIRETQRQDHSWAVQNTAKGQCGWRRVKEGTVEIRESLGAFHVGTYRSL